MLPLYLHQSALKALVEVLALLVSSSDTTLTLEPWEGVVGEVVGRTIGIIHLPEVEGPVTSAFWWEMARISAVKDECSGVIFAQNRAT